MTQNDAIQKYLEEGHRLTPIDALNLFGCFRLSGRIFDLKARGLDIKMDMVENKSTGKRYAEYYLDKSAPVMECTAAEADSCEPDDLFFLNECLMTENVMKYKLTDETKEVLGRTLHRIVCVTAFASVSVGDVGGWVESENNLSQEGNAWVYGNAKVYGNALVYGDAEVSGNALVYGDAEVSGNALVYGDAEVSGNAKVYGDAKVCGDAWVSGDAEVYGDAWVSGNAKVHGNAEVVKTSDYAVYKNTWSSMRYFTWTRSNDKWAVGCFYGTGKELIAKAYNDSELSGKCYEAVVNMRNELTKLEQA